MEERLWAALPAIYGGEPLPEMLGGTRNNAGRSGYRCEAIQGSGAKVAEMAHDGLARVINPLHTPADGDTSLFGSYRKVRPGRQRSFDRCPGGGSSIASCSSCNSRCQGRRRHTLIRRPLEKKSRTEGNKGNEEQILFFVALVSFC